MHYLIGRDLDGDGRYEFIQDMQNMILTEDPDRALQVSEYDLTYIDMAHLNQYGFYALEADRFHVSSLERLLFRPRVRGFRPPIAPPPRRRMVPPAPRPMMGLRRPGAPRPVLGHPSAPRHVQPHMPARQRPGGGLFGRPMPGGKGPGGRGGRGFGW